MLYFAFIATQAIKPQVDLSDRISFAALMISFIFLIINLIISLRANLKSERSALASEKSAVAAERSVLASEHAALSSAKSVFIAEKSAEAGIRSAEAAEKSATQTIKANEQMEHQTKLFETDLKNTHSPLLLPVIEQFSLPIIPFDISYISASEANFKLDIINVSLGNAYKVSAQLEIDKNFIINEYKNKKSNIFYNTHNDHCYELDYQINEKQKTDFITTKINYDESSEENNFKTSFYSDNSKIVPILRKDESIKVDIPSYATRILIDMLYRYSTDKKILESHYKEKIKIIIRYQTWNEIESDEYITKEHYVSITEASPYFTFPKDEFSELEITGLTVSLKTKFVK